MTEVRIRKRIEQIGRFDSSQGYVTEVRIHVSDRVNRIHVSDRVNRITVTLYKVQYNI